MPEKGPDPACKNLSVFEAILTEDGYLNKVHKQFKNSRFRHNMRELIPCPYCAKCLPLIGKPRLLYLGYCLWAQDNGRFYCHHRALGIGETNLWQ